MPPGSPRIKPSNKKRSRFTAAVWAILGGSLGCHRFYLKEWLWALPYILLSILGGLLFMKACATLTTNDIIGMLSTNKLPESITTSIYYIASIYLMGIPAVAGIIEGIIYLCRSKESFN